MNLKVKQDTMTLFSFDIHLSDTACQHIKTILLKQNQLYCELALSHTGCSGYRYHFKTVNEHQAHEALLKSHIVLNKSLGIRLLVNKEYRVWLNGLVVDYGQVGEEANLKKQFIYHNPNEKGHCGCGESFYVERE